MKFKVRQPRNGSEPLSRKIIDESLINLILKLPCLEELEIDTSYTLNMNHEELVGEMIQQILKNHK